jgi:hypothetical protein
MACADITFTRDRRSVIHRAMYCMQCMYTVASLQPKYHGEMKPRDSAAR